MYNHDDHTVKINPLIWSPTMLKTDSPKSSKSIRENDPNSNEIQITKQKDNSKLTPKLNNSILFS